MALPEYLKEDYKDDVLDLTQNANRKYEEIDNQDGSISFNDVTVYEEEGDAFGALDINATNSFVNAMKRTIAEQMTAIASQIQALNNTKSHVGMVIQSTTLNTEAKVIAQYGGTHWTKIEGKFLLGQSSSYGINTTGGAASVTLTENQLPVIQSKLQFRRAGTHDDGSTIVGTYTSTNQHAQVNESSGETWQNSINNLAAYAQQTDVVDISFGGGQSHTNMPPYKVVYIWERTA